MKPSVSTEPPIRFVECGNCGAEAWGYAMRELKREGWESHQIRTYEEFLLCGECAPLFEARRTAAADKQ